MVRALIAAAAASVALASGCATIHVHRVSDPPMFLKDKRKRPERNAGEWTYKNYLLGVESFSDPILLDRVCPYRWETVTTEVSAWQGILRVMTLNLYSPWTVRVSCGDAPPKEPDQDL